MNWGTRQCSICNKVLDTSKKTTLTTITELFKFLIVKVNCKLLEECLICGNCLAKIQLAYKFKTLYLDGLQRTLTDVTVKEETNPGKYMRCEICKINHSDCIPLFDSVTENGFNLIKYLSAKLESKIQKKHSMCETCNKSLINFYDITNSISIFGRCDVVDSDSKSDNKKTQAIDNNLSCTSCNKNFEYVEVEMDCPSADLKREEECDDFHERFVLKSEEVDLKMEIEDDSETCQQNERETNEMSSLLNHESETELSTSESENISNTDKIDIFKCQICNLQLKRKYNLKRHMATHKPSDKVEIFRCRICEFKTRYKTSLNNHTMVHSDKLEMLKCQNCEFKTKNKWYLKQHMLHTHKNPKVEIFKCQNCEYRSKYKGNLKKHEVKHKKIDEIDTFSCHNCEYKTKRKNDLKNHIRRIHENCDLKRK